jgi:hypothetical protein
LLTLADVAARTGLSLTSVRRDRYAGRLAVLCFGRAIRVTEAAYEAYLRAHELDQP